MDLINSFETLPFEVKKDTAHIFNNFVRKNLAGFVTYLSSHFKILGKI